MEILEINDSNREAVLELFGKTLDNEGYITEKKTNKRLICPYSKDNIKASNFSILPGSAIFVNNYYYCLAEYLVSKR